VIRHLSAELKRNPGGVVALLPLPAIQATLSSIELAMGQKGCFPTTDGSSLRMPALIA
jgi:hypothetical protein